MSDAPTRSGKKEMSPEDREALEAGDAPSARKIFILCLVATIAFYLTMLLSM